MAWIKVEANASLSGGVATYWVTDPETTDELQYRCQSPSAAIALAAKLNSVDYP